MDNHIFGLLDIGYLFGGEMSRAAYAIEYRQQREQFFLRKLEEIRDQMNADPFYFDYNEALQAVIAEFPADKTIIQDVWKKVTGAK